MVNTVLNTIMVDISPYLTADAFVAIIFMLMDTTTCSIDKTFNLNDNETTMKTTTTDALLI